jgi:hypothetical protein
MRRPFGFPVGSLPRLRARLLHQRVKGYAPCGSLSTVEALRQPWVASHRSARAVRALPASAPPARARRVSRLEASRVIAAPIVQDREGFEFFFPSRLALLPLQSSPCTAGLPRVDVQASAGSLVASDGTKNLLSLGSSRAFGQPVAPATQCGLTLPSRGRPKPCGFRPPLMSNVRRHTSTPCYVNYRVATAQI